MKAFRTVLSLLFVSSFLLTACGGGTPVPAQATEKQTVVVTVQAPPAKVTKLRIAFPSSPGMDDVSPLIALDALADKGYAVLPTFYAQGELAAAALQRGDAEFGAGAPSVWLLALQKGVPLKWIASKSAYGIWIIGNKDINGCQDLTGKRFAIHSEIAIGTAAVNYWLKRDCPDVKPNFITVAGSDNRAAAMLAGQVDATPLELADVQNVLAKGGNKFKLIADLGQDKDIGKVKGSGWFVRQDFLDKNPQAVQDFLVELMKNNRHVVQDPAWFQAQATQRIPGLNPVTLTDTVKSLLAINNWPVDGGLTKDNAEFTINFLSGNKNLQPGLTVDQAVDLKPLTAALAALGK